MPGLEWEPIDALPPQIRGRTKNGKYRAILVDFLDSGVPAGKVTMPEGLKLQAVSVGLRKALTWEGEEDLTDKVIIRQMNGSIFLARIPLP